MDSSWNIRGAATVESVASPPKRWRKQMPHYGLDVSDNNPHPINWAAAYTHLKALGGGAQPFVFVKVSQGTTYVNEDAAGDIAAAKAAGFAVAGYLMLVGGESVPAQLQVFQQHSSATFPKAYDIELPAVLTTAEYVAEVKQLLAENEVALVYYDQSEVEQEGFPTEPSVGLWLAEYNNLPGSVSFAGTTVHQYTDIGTIPGCAGQFDLNVWLGTEPVFNAYFQLAPPAPPTPPKPPAPPKPPVEVNVNVPVLSPGSTEANYVKAVQSILALKFGQKVGADGTFGSQTVAAVENVQRFFKLPANGVVDEATWGVLLAL
jgi:GH25 family lysozyme M1 (1,4-beta-N-acetylmuramidase)